MCKLTVILPLVLASLDASAMMRCGVWIIEPGQSRFEVREKCGDPQGADQHTEWRPLTTYQQQCQTINEPVYQSTPGPAGSQAPAATYVPRTLCTTVPVSITVPVEVEIWYYDDPSVPKAPHFENGRLYWIEPLWKLRHPN